MPFIAHPWRKIFSFITGTKAEPAVSDGGSGGGGDYRVINFIIATNQVARLEVACSSDISTRIHSQDYLEKMNNHLRVKSSAKDEARRGAVWGAERQQPCERSTGRGGMCQESAA